MRDRLITASLVALGVAPIVVAALGLWIWSWPLSAGDRLAAIGDAIGAGTPVLAFTAGVIAYVAYQVALSRPHLAP